MPEIRRILFATDFSERSQAAWDYAALLATTFGAELHAVHVVQEPLTTVPEAGLAVAAPSVNIAELLDAAKQGLERLHVAAPGRVAERATLAGPTADEIVRYARESAADVVVIGTHGRTGLAHVLLGSIAERIVRTSPCPVLTVRPPAHAT